MKQQLGSFSLRDSGYYGFQHFLVVWFLHCGSFSVGLLFGGAALEIHDEYTQAHQRQRAGGAQTERLLGLAEEQSREQHSAHRIEESKHGDPAHRVMLEQHRPQAVSRRRNERQPHQRAESGAGEAPLLGGSAHQQSEEGKHYAAENELQR